MKNVLYINAKLQGFLALGITNNNSGYVLNQKQTETNITL